MSARRNSIYLLDHEEIVAPPAIEIRACEDQNFELPTRIYAAMALCFAGFVGVLANAFRTSMAVPYGIILAFLVAFFAVPTLFVRLSGSEGSKALSWGRFRYRGIHTATGHTGPGEATILILMLPAFVLCFGIAITIIAALVR